MLRGAGETRRFLRPKGLLALAWSPSTPLDVNLSLHRRVGQLNFGDILATVNLTDESCGNLDRAYRLCADWRGPFELATFG